MADHRADSPRPAVRHLSRLRGLPRWTLTLGFVAVVVTAGVPGYAATRPASPPDVALAAVPTATPPATPTVRTATPLPVPTAPPTATAPATRYAMPALGF